MAEYNYAAQASTIKIEDITSDEHNQTMLQRIKDNDTSVNELYIYSVSCPDTDVEHCNSDNYYYFPDFVYNEKELGWLGYYIGQNTTIQTLHFFEMNCNMYDSERSFFEGLSCNKTIQCIDIDNFHISEGRLFSMMVPFFKSNDSLSEIKIGYCGFEVEGTRQLSLAIGNCGQSLEKLSIDNIDNEMENGQLVDIITALSMHPQLEELDLSCNRTNMGRNECMALSTLLRHTTTKLQNLILYGNNINDDGVEVLVQALHGHTLQELNLGGNESITIRGWTVLSTLLEMPGSNLEELDVGNNNFGNEGALVFANALTNNSTLKTLGLYVNGISAEGWAHFSKLLCDTSSINTTYQSNHTLCDLGPDVHANIQSNLTLNKREDKQHVAMSKILQCHPHFNMEPFFEWEFKVLPIMIKWFEKVAARVRAYDYKVSRLRRLSSTFDFIREFPMLYIEPVTGKEIAEYTTIEKQLEGKPLWQEKLVEIRGCKARSMRRLGMK